MALIKKGSAIFLADHSLLIGRLTGLLRDSEGKRMGAKHTARNSGDSDEIMERQHIVGATGELAFARMTGLSWQATYNDRAHDPDVLPDFQIRTRGKYGGELIIREKDLEHQRFVLMYVGSDPTLYFFCGWIYGGEGMQMKWYGDPGNRGYNCFMVPQSELRDLEI